MWFLVLGKMESELYAADVFHAYEHDFGDYHSEVAPDRCVDEDYHDDEAHHADLSVIFPEIFRKEIEEKVRAVQGRNGEKVEKEEHDAHSRHRHDEVLEEKPGLLFRNKWEDPKDQKRDDEKNEVGKGAGEGDDDVVSDEVAEIVGIDRNRLAPTYEHKSAWGEDIDERDNDRSPDVDVRNWAKGYPAKIFGRVVAATVSGQGVGALVPGYIEKQDTERYGLS